MIKLEDVKKILENSNIKYKEIENGIVILKEERYNYLFEIREILKTFGITNDDLTITEDGTLIKSKQFDSQKLKMVLSPFYPLDKMEVIDAYTLKMVDLIIDSLNEDADGSADDLGEVPDATADDEDESLGIDELSQLLDNKFPETDIIIVDDNTLEIPTSDEIVEFLKSIEDKLENFDIEITDDKIIVKGN